MTSTLSQISSNLPVLIGYVYLLQFQQTIVPANNKILEIYPFFQKLAILPYAQDNVNYVILNTSLI